VEDYTRYTGMAFELLILILVMVFIGKKIDSWLGFEKPLMLVLLVCFGMVGYMVKIYYQTNKKKNNDK